jgi:peroxiredoxin
MKPLRVTTLGVCPEKARTLESLAARDSLPILWLADVTGEVSALYGFYDFGSSRILPGFVLMDPQGIVRLSLVGQSVPAEDVARLVRLAVTGTN